MPRQRAPLSSVTNTKRWVLPVDRVGAVSFGHLTVAGQLIVPDVFSTSRANAYAPEGALLKVKVLLALMVLVN
jgi:hypothetical protein